jgi:hypothetical protein
VTPITITPDVEQNPWTDIDLATVGHGRIERIGLLRNGTSEGRASVAMVIRLDDGTAVVAETTWRLFDTSARALAVSAVAAEETRD